MTIPITLLTTTPNRSCRDPTRRPRRPPRPHPPRRARRPAHRRRRPVPARPPRGLQLARRPLPRARRRRRRPLRLPGPLRLEPGPAVPAPAGARPGGPVPRLGRQWGRDRGRGGSPRAARVCRVDAHGDGVAVRAAGRLQQHRDVYRSRLSRLLFFWGGGL